MKTANFLTSEDRPSTRHTARLGVFFRKALRGASTKGATSSRPFIFPSFVRLNGKANNMDTNEQNLKRAKQTFEKAAGPNSADDAACLIGEGLAHLTDALLVISQSLDETRRELEIIKKMTAKNSK